MSFQQLTTRSEALHPIEKASGTMFGSIHLNRLGIAEKRSEEDPIKKKLPTEIFYKIFSFLSEEDLKSVALVAHFWKHASSHIRKNRQFVLVKNFGKNLIQNIDNNEDLKQKILDTINDKEILKTSNLLAAKAIIIFQREIILEGLTKLSSERQDSLKASFHDFPTPNLFEGIFELAKSQTSNPSNYLNVLIDLGFTLKALDFFEKIPYKETLWNEFPKKPKPSQNTPIDRSNSHRRSLSLLNELSSRPLIKEIPEQFITSPNRQYYLNRFLPRARAIDGFEAAVKLFEPEKRNQQLSSICQIFINEGDFNRALKTAEAIDSNYGARDKLLSAICKGFSYESDSKKALKTIEAIDSNYDGRTELLTFICKSLIREGEFHEALKVVRMIPDKELRDMFFSDISDLSNQNGGKAKDLEIAYEIAYYKPRSLALQDISKALIAKSDMFKMEELSELIPDEFERNLTLQDISETFARTNNLKKALEAICLISNENRKTSTLRNICEILTLENDIEKTLEVAQLISNDEIKDSIILNACKTLLKNNKIDACLKTALKITNEKEKNRVLSEVSKGFTLEQSFDKALEAVHLISEREIKAASTQNILEALAQKNDFIKALEVSYLIYEGRSWSVCKEQKDPIIYGNDTLFLVSADTRSRFLKYLCEQQIERGTIGKLSEIASKIPDASEREIFLNHACGTLIKKNQLEDALKVIQSISDKGGEQRCRLYKKVLKIYFGKNEPKALEIINRLDHDQEKAIILERLSKWFTRKKNFKKASEMAFLINLENNKNSAITYLHDAYIKDGKLDEASKIARFMSASTPDATLQKLELLARSWRALTEDPQTLQKMFN